ncbi:MAG: PQQ-binding-like beta-propeller repeat protein [Wolbachia endosymbiont of Menacanthus eurysternus]|nr:MAG: PQQ-binding-like beta-propeller repeat protein [Wolbachia endosymbiont of Menacanthus eurysternus]
MKTIIIMIISLLYNNYITANEQIPLIDKKLSQGDIAPILVENNIILVDKYGTLYSFKRENPKILNWKLNFPYKKIYNMSLSHYKKTVFFIINNILFSVDEKTGKIQWEKELKAPVRGKAIAINNKLLLLTIDNCLYAFNIKNGNYTWNYQNNVNPIRGLYSISPVISNNKIIAPFSNGELIAFNENGKKLWSQKLTTNILDTQFTDITTTPKTFDDILIVTNNSHIYGINVNLGKILWSKQLKIRNMSDIVSYYNPSVYIEKQESKKVKKIIFTTTKDNKIIGIEIENGEIIWSSDLIKKNIQLLDPIVHANTLWITSNKGLIFAFPRFGNLKKTIEIPNVFRYALMFTKNKIYVTTKKNGIFSLKNIFTSYD